MLPILKNLRCILFVIKRITVIFLINMMIVPPAYSVTIDTSLFELSQQTAAQRAQETSERILHCANYYNRTALAFKYGSTGKYYGSPWEVSEDRSIGYHCIPNLGCQYYCRYNDSGYRSYQYDSLQRCTKNGSIIEPYLGFGHICKNPNNTNPNKGTWVTDIVIYQSGTSGRNQDGLTKNFPDLNKDVLCLSGLAYVSDLSLVTVSKYTNPTSGEYAEDRYALSNNIFNEDYLESLQQDCRASIGK